MTLGFRDVMSCDLASAYLDYLSYNFQFYLRDPCLRLTCLGRLRQVPSHSSLDRNKLIVSQA